MRGVILQIHHERFGTISCLIGRGRIESFASALMTSAALLDRQESTVQ